MSKDLESKNKKELVSIIEQLQQKLVEMQGVEAKQEASESKLNGLGFSVVRNKENEYQLVEIAFDFATGAAKVKKVENLATKDYAIAAHRAKMQLFDKVLHTDNLDHLKKEN